MSIKISVTIPTMGRETLTATLRSLERQTVMPHEVLVVNQGPRDVEDRHHFNLPISYLHQDAKGLSRARNRALETFSGDWLMFTDDDQEVNAEWVEQLGILADSYPDVAIIGGPVFPPPKYDPEVEFVSQMYVHGEVILDRTNYLTPTAFPGVLYDIWGGNFALSRKCIDIIGAYDEAFGRGSGLFDVGEDTDYTMRIFSAGLKGLLSCRMIIYHTFGGRPHSAQMTTDTVEVAAAMQWKSNQNRDTTDPNLARRIFPYGKKKALLNRLSGGMAFGQQAIAQETFNKTLEKLDKDWTLQNGLLRKKVADG